MLDASHTPDRSLRQSEQLPTHRQWKCERCVDKVDAEVEDEENHRQDVERRRVHRGPDDRAVTAVPTWKIMDHQKELGSISRKSKPSTMA